jgi:hypothetical protein
LNDDGNDAIMSSLLKCVLGNALAMQGKKQKTKKGKAFYGRSKGVILDPFKICFFLFHLLFTLWVPKTFWGPKPIGVQIRVQTLNHESHSPPYATIIFEIFYKIFLKSLKIFKIF